MWHWGFFKGRESAYLGAVFAFFMAGSVGNGHIKGWSLLKALVYHMNFKSQDELHKSMTLICKRIRTMIYKQTTSRMIFCESHFGKRFNIEASTTPNLHNLGNRIGLGEVTMIVC